MGTSYLQGMFSGYIKALLLLGLTGHITKLFSPGSWVSLVCAEPL